MKIEKCKKAIFITALPHLPSSPKIPVFHFFAQKIITANQTKNNQQGTGAKGRQVKIILSGFSKGQNKSDQESQNGKQH